MMVDVVAERDRHRGRRSPACTVAGKTGTAQHGEGAPPHAWFVSSRRAGEIRRSPSRSSCSTAVALAATRRGAGRRADREGGHGGRAWRTDEGGRVERSAGGPRGPLPRRARARARRHGRRSSWAPTRCSGGTVAIKILAPQFADDDELRAAVPPRGAGRRAPVNHPNIVSVFDTGADDGVHFIVMEYVEGRTLADYLAGGGRIMPDRAIEIAEDVCGALSAAHAQGVIHRDIKPGNIMLTRDGAGEGHRLRHRADDARPPRPSRRRPRCSGTASYLSPEQAQGQPVDGRSDIYSLGVRAVRDGHGPAAVPRRLARRGRLQAGARAADPAVDS